LISPDGIPDQSGDPFDRVPQCFAMNPAITPKTKEERDAVFTTLFANVKPADQQSPSVKQLLEPYREQIVQKRKEGYNLRQIAEVMKQEPIGIKIAVSTLQKFARTKSKKHRKTKATTAPQPTQPATAAVR
jgi:hypothetical protein